MGRNLHRRSLTSICTPPELRWLIKKKRSCFINSRSSLLSTITPMEIDVKDESRRPWGDLPEDIMELIVLQLSLKDYARLSTACRGWRWLFRPDARSMCLVLLRRYTGAFYAADPASGKIDHGGDISELAGARLLTSKRQWLLIQKGDGIFFFDPRSRQRYDVPYKPKPGWGRAAHFSSASVSTNFSVVVLDDDSPVSSRIGVWRMAQRDWKFYRFCCSNIKNKSRFYLYGDYFCCLRRDCRFGIFNLKENKWSIYDLPEPARGDLDDGLVYITEFDEGLYVILICAKKRRRLVRIFRVYLSAMELVEIEGLGNRTIYVDPISAHMEMAPTREMAEKIYFPTMKSSSTRHSIDYYCMRTRRCYSSVVDMAKKLTELFEEGKSGRDYNCEFRAWIEEEQQTAAPILLS